jgi:hypothetical protein
MIYTLRKLLKEKDSKIKVQTHSVQQNENDISKFADDNNKLHF